ncbi:hypothetical protein GCM10010987_76410 [Bradyrhizobium guangdongense]|uniref:Uncharacterized protein n=1 Tax=Bradyrhizobium guangdongense TaxID=1325090 RepID=A0AA87WGL8_9BRAD|nr:hypothetical protein GCM10010987_76410 [Bradyrhizobium guangdongense]
MLDLRRDLRASVDNAGSYEESPPRPASRPGTDTLDQRSSHAAGPSSYLKSVAHRQPTISRAMAVVTITPALLAADKG